MDIATYKISHEVYSEWIQNIAILLHAEDESKQLPEKR